MKFAIYAQRDELAGTFGNLLIMHEAVAQRNFKWMTKESEEADCEDRAMYLMGYYDNETGAILSQQPQKVWDMEREKKEMMKNGG